MDKCIITFARSWISLVLTRKLGENGIRVITGDVTRLAPASLSRFSYESFTYPDSFDEPERFIDKLVEVAEAHYESNGNLVLIPQNQTCFVVAAHRHRFEGLVKMALPSLEKLEQVHDKGALAELCKHQNIWVPPTIVAKEREEFKDRAIEIKYPAFVKLRKSSASVGIEKVDNADKAIEVFERLIDDFDLSSEQYPVFQQMVEGQELCSAFLLENGKPRMEMTYRNLRQYPDGRGIGFLRETVDAKNLEATGIELLGALEWHGVAEIDFIVDEDGRHWLIDVNPRFWGGLAQSVESGWNFPLKYYQLAAEGHVEPFKTAAKDIKTFNPCLAMLHAFEELTKSSSAQKEITEAMEELKNNFSHEALSSMSGFISKLGSIVNPRERFVKIFELLDESRGAFDEFFQWDDPIPVLGLLYPLMIFIKNRKVSLDSLVPGGKPK